MSKQSFDEGLREKLKALVFDEWEYGDFLKEGLDSYVTAILTDIRKHLPEKKDPERGAKPQDYMDIGFNEALDDVAGRLGL